MHQRNQVKTSPRKGKLFVKRGRQGKKGNHRRMNSRKSSMKAMRSLAMNVNPFIEDSTRHSIMRSANSGAVSATKDFLASHT